MFAYVDDVVGENVQTVRENTEIFIKVSKDIALHVNFENTKYNHIPVSPPKYNTKSNYSNCKFIVWKCGNNGNNYKRLSEKLNSQ